MYDENGNLVSYFKKKILYVINFSLHEGDNSNIQQTKPVIPIEIDMTLDGIGGLKPGDMFRVDYLPKVYRDFAYFQIFQVNHSMGTSGWETKINGKMKLDLIKMRKEGHKIILWTNRGDNEEYPVLTEAINWCKEKGLEFDAVNKNLPGQNKLSGPSPKVMADIYIDDLAINIKDWKQILK